MLLLAILFHCFIIISPAERSNYDQQSDEDDYLPPRVTIAIPVHPHNKVNILPYTLGSIESQLYPKERISVHFFLGIYAPTIANQTRKRLNAKTESMINDWEKYWSPESTAGASECYHSIKVHEEIQVMDEETDESEYWSKERYSRIMSLKQKALHIALEEWSDFLLLTDADVVYTNDSLLRYLLLESGNSSISVFAPMIESLGTYSNFWAGVTSSGYYARTADYLPMLQRETVGWFPVPMIHSSIFIDLNNPTTHELTFYPDTQEDPFDDIIAFAFSVHRLGMQFFVNNDHIWGFIPPPITSASSDVSDQQLIDLQLEALIESPGFTVAKALQSQFSNASHSDTLGVDQVYIINLLRRPERRERMSKTLKVLGIEATFWPATDGKSLTSDQLINLGIRQLPNYRDPFQKRPMTYGEIGCFMSHYTLWQHLVESNDSLIMVLEDDVRFTDNFRVKYNHTLSQVDWSTIDFLYLGRKAQGEGEEEVISSNLVKPKYSYWTIGYIISKRGARKLLDADPLPTLLPVDEFLPIMYDASPFKEWSKYFPRRNLNAASASPLLVSPSHFIGDQEYISDTEDSNVFAGEGEKANVQTLIGPDGKFHRADEL